MKLLTICIPCHNSLTTMHKSISSCLLMKEELEVIIVDENSTDETYMIAKEYEKEYPDTIKVIKIGDYDSAIEAAIDHSEGLYFKVLQCQDYFNQPSLVSVIETLRDIIRIQANLDLLLTNYKVAIPEEKEYLYSYAKTLPTETLFGWHSLKKISQWTLFNNAALTFKTSILKQIQHQVKQMGNYFELWSYLALTHVKSMYYLNIPFYCFGKKPYQYDQYDSQYISDLLMTLFTSIDVYALKSRKQRHYFIHYLSVVFIIAMVWFVNENQEASKIKLWKEMALHDPKLFKAIYHQLPGRRIGLDNKLGNTILMKNYDLLKSKFHM